MGAASGLRALAAARRSLQARTIVAVMIVIGGLAGAWLGKSTGAAIGLAFAYWIGAIVWWRHFDAALADHFSNVDLTDTSLTPVVAHDQS